MDVSDYRKRLVELLEKHASPSTPKINVPKLKTPENTTNIPEVKGVSDPPRLTSKKNKIDVNSTKSPRLNNVGGSNPSFSSKMNDNNPYRKR